MKFLQEYIEEKQTECLNKFGVIFAFSVEQFHEQKAPDTTYVNMGMGMLCPKEHVRQFIDEHHQIVTEGIAQDISDNGADAIIVRELHNHESFYTGDPTNAIEALSAYGFTIEHINKIFREEQIKYYENENY